MSREKREEGKDRRGQMGSTLSCGSECSGGIHDNVVELKAGMMGSCSIEVEDFRKGWFSMMTMFRVTRG